MGDPILQSSCKQINVKNEVFNHFAIQWNDLSFEVHKRFLERQLASISGRNNCSPKKQIIKCVKGTIKSRELTAILGPSGAGKSTLIECIAGIRKRGRSGQISIYGNVNQINLAFIPQQDIWFGVLTVKESLLFASKLKNSTRAKNDNDYMAFTVDENKGKIKLARSKTIKDKDFHRDIASNIMSLLGLEEVANVSIKNISGGQKKRLSIANELVSKPNMLILDEPTSGLDSSASLQCIQLLQRLTQQKMPMAIVCTIHQPNPKTFHLFHKVFILSAIGKCIYEGSPLSLVEHLKKVDIECPSFYNPADFIIELASGEHGLQVVEKLAAIHETVAVDTVSSFRSSYVLEEVTVQPKFPFFYHFFCLFHRSMLLILRNRLLLTIRFVSHIFTALFVSYLYGSVGKAGGCPPDIIHGFSFEGMNSARNATINESKKLLDNVSLLFISAMTVQYFSIMATVISFPLQMSVFLKEKRNNWYDIGSYFWAIILSDTPFQLICPAAYVCITYLMTEQIRVMWRFEVFMAANILIALISQCQGLIIGAIFMRSVPTAVYIASLSNIPMVLLCGFFVKLDTMPKLLKQLSNLSYVRFGLESIIIAIYGFDRCGNGVEEKLESMRRILVGWFGRMSSIVHQALHEEEEYDDHVDKGIKNTTYESVVSTEDTEQMSSMSKTFVDAIMLGVGAEKRDKDGNIVSGVLSLFGLEDDGIYHCFLMLLIYVVLFQIATYIILHWRVNTRN